MFWGKLHHDVIYPRTFVVTVTPNRACFSPASSSSVTLDIESYRGTRYRTKTGPVGGYSHCGTKGHGEGNSELSRGLHRVIQMVTEGFSLKFREGQRPFTVRKIFYGGKWD